MLNSHRSKARPLLLRELVIGKCELLVSVHASIKVFLASDRAPVTLPQLSRVSLVTSPSQLATDMGFHYGTGALYSAGKWLYIYFLCVTGCETFQHSSKSVLKPGQASE